MASSYAQTTDFWDKQLASTTNQFLFGYGSLINSTSRNSTAGRTIPAIPARISAGFGYIRSWGERIPTGFTALVLRKAQPTESPTTVNGVLYPVDEKDLPRFDEREIGYKRTAIPLEFVQSVTWQRLPADARIWVYAVAERPQVPDDHKEMPDRDHPIVQSYIDLVIEGALEYGEDFAIELIATTVDWNQFWLNDRQIPRRPWIMTKGYKQIDRLLSTTAPAASQFGNRQFPEVYAVRHYSK